ncbi:MAG: MarR family transcriptional regulator [Thermaerobacter sp.]|nr:MarR family transcriptional regulator [Thermaerobacter sp.]
MEKREAALAEAMEALYRLRRRWLCWLKQRSTRLGIGVGQLAFLRFLAYQGSITAGEVAEHVGVAPSAVTAMADRLCAQGIVERLRDEADRRQVRLSLTPEGRAVAGQLMEELKSSVLDRLDDRDMQDLRRIVGKLEAGLGGDGKGKSDAD